MNFTWQTVFHTTVVFMALIGVSTGAHAGQVGVTTLEIVDPVTDRSTTAFVWYPASEDTGSTQVGPFTLDASSDVSPSPGHHPLVVISHGNGGGPLSHHDTAHALAEAGFIAAAPAHVGDNFRDGSLMGSPQLLESRPQTISALISTLIDDERLQVDTDRIGLFGFSMGGFTGLALLGAEPAYTQFSRHCTRFPGDPVCRWNTNLTDEPELIEGLGDDRISTAVIAAPMTAFFADEAFANLRGPILLMFGTHDELILVPSHIDRLSNQPSVVGVWELEGAGHYSFLAPFPDVIRAEVGEVAEDPPGFDRHERHEDMNARIVEFFQSTL